MNKIKEVTKNFFVCGILMVIAGIALFAVSKKTFGVLAVACGVVFVVIGIVYLVKDLRDNSSQEQENGVVQITQSESVKITENRIKYSCKLVIFVIIF